MNKQEFLDELKKGLCGLPENDVDERLDFYSEMIDDRMEDGISEEDTIAELGDIDDIISQIIDDTPLLKLVKEKAKSKRKISTLEIVLLIVGSPIWLSLLISVISVVLSAYISLWAVIISLWATAIALGASTFALLIYGIFTIIQGNVLTGIAVLACCCVTSGISIYFDFGCKWASKGVVILTKKTPLWIKKVIR